MWIEEGFDMTKKRSDTPIADAVKEVQKVLATLPSDRDRLIALEYLQRKVEQDSLNKLVIPIVS